MTASTIPQLLAELQGPKGESASCALLAMGPEVVPELRHHFARAPSPIVRKYIVEIIDQLRRPDDLEFSAVALQDNEEGVWQAAIDALASQPGEVSLNYLRSSLQRESAVLRPNDRKVSFLQEAVEELQKPNPFGVGESGVGPA